MTKKTELTNAYGEFVYQKFNEIKKLANSIVSLVSYMDWSKDEIEELYNLIEGDFDKIQEILEDKKFQSIIFDL